MNAIEQYGLLIEQSARFDTSDDLLPYTDIVYTLAYIYQQVPYNLNNNLMLAPQNAKAQQQWI